jgi:hypothetical protein
LPDVLYGFGAWYLTLREARRLGLLENGELRKVFSCKRKEMKRE